VKNNIGAMAAQDMAVAQGPGGLDHLQAAGGCCGICFKHAELSLAAYVPLQEGVPSVDILMDEGRATSEPQATRFASGWTVIDQCKHISDPCPVHDEITGAFVRYGTAPRQARVALVVGEVESRSLCDRATM
jgi:hypothetical protein